MKISTIFILNLPKYDPFGDVRDDVPEAPGNLDHLIHFVARTLNYLSFKFHNDMTNTLATIYCHRSLPPKSNFWQFKTTVPRPLTLFRYRQGLGDESGDAMSAMVMFLFNMFV